MKPVRANVLRKPRSINEENKQREALQMEARQGRPKTVLLGKLCLLPLTNHTKTFGTWKKSGFCAPWKLRSGPPSRWPSGRAGSGLTFVACGTVVASRRFCSENCAQSTLLRYSCLIRNGMAWFIPAFLWLKSRNNPNATGRKKNNIKKQKLIACW